MEKLRSKDTRWDRIRKRHLNSVNVKTETVKKFIEMDYIGKRNTKLLNGDVALVDNLDPSLVISLRHEMIDRKRRSNQEHNASAGKRLTVAKLKAHNQSVEEHYIGNELTKFRAQLEKSRLRLKIKEKPSLKVDNSHILKSLDICTERIEDFYSTSIEAIEKSEEESKAVRFVDDVEVISYERTEESDEIDSVISNLAEEVLNEIEEEAKLELIEEKMQTLQLQGEKCAQSTEGDVLRIVQIQPERVEETVEEEECSLTEEEDEDDSTDEQNAILQQLFFQPKFPPDDVLLKTYLLRWVHFTTLSKIEKRNFSKQTDNIRKINAFLDNIRREKGRFPKDSVETTEGKKTSVVVAKKYQNKIKIQQDIIDLQKLKLERQERMIMELKLNKLSDEAKQAREEIKNELKAAMRSGEVKNRSKVKSLQLMGNLRDEDDEEFSRLQGKALLMPKFLAKMQERALERSVKHEQARQRRLAQEAEREAVKIAAEEAKRLEDEEAKRLRIEALKEKRRLEKMAKVIKERERQRWIEINQKCQAFHRKRLLNRIGMEAFRRLLARKRQNHRKAEQFRKHLIKKTAFNAWKFHYVQIWERKAKKADDFYQKLMLRRALTAWLLLVQDGRSKYLVACDWYDLKLSESMFERWSRYTKLQKLIETTKMHQAASHHEWHLKWKVLDRWQRLPQILKLEKETDERRQRWRMKIWELLPDYTPDREAI